MLINIFTIARGGSSGSSRLTLFYEFTAETGQILSMRVVDWGDGARENIVPLSPSRTVEHAQTYDAGPGQPLLLDSFARFNVTLSEAPEVSVQEVSLFLAPDAVLGMAAGLADARRGLAWLGAGNDTLRAGGQNDTVFGNDGDDLIFGRNGADLLRGEAGRDTLLGGAGAETLLGFAQDDRLVGGHGNDSLQGGDGDDILTGGNGDDTLRGGEGADALAGGAGNDSVWGGNGDDRMRGDAGNDTLRGGAGADRMQGNDGNDELYGEDGNDLLRGGAGADTLNGGAGADTIFGDAGADLILSQADGVKDVFVYTSLGHGGDIIRGFVSGQDEIRLLLPYNAPLVQGAAPVAGVGPTLLFNTGTGQLSLDADGLGGEAAVLIATLQGVTVLAARDVIFG